MGRGRITRGGKKNIKSDSEDEGADRSKREKKKKSGKKYLNCWEMNRKGNTERAKNTIGDTRKTTAAKEA